MCADNGHQGVIWSDQKRKGDTNPIQIVQTFHCLTSGASGMDLVSSYSRKTNNMFLLFSCIVTVELALFSTI